MISFFRELQESRPLRTAIFVSVLWHLVWMFVFVIDVKDPAVKPKLEPKIYFVGPILSDDAFNLILETKPEFSTTVYRSGGQGAPELEPQPQEMERADPGDLVSVPLGRSTWESLWGRLKNEKPYPDVMFRKKLPVDPVRPPFPIAGETLASRGLLAAPAFPALPDRDGDPRTDPEYELTVNGAGLVQETRQVISSGDPELDRILERYLKQWQFIPLEEARRGVLEKGRVRIPADGGKGQG